MKQIALYITLNLILNIGLKCQNYVSFPTENVNWNVYLLSTCDEGPPDTILLRYTLHGDTTINEISYRKLCLERGDTSNPKIQAVGGLREENKKIYYIGQTFVGAESNREYLLYDFTKQIGDTIRHDSFGGFYSVVLGIDSIPIGDSYRKRFEVDNHWFYHNPDYIVEGIGSVLNGLLGHISDIPTCGFHYWEHICFRENGEVKYLNPSFNDCFPKMFFTKIYLLSRESEIKLYPNPIDNKLLIENNTNEHELIIKIIDMNGRTMIEEKLIDKSLTVDLKIVTGIYNVIILNNKGQILLKRKIIKK
jgi:hypothetical protein